VTGAICKKGKGKKKKKKEKKNKRKNKKKKEKKKKKKRGGVAEQKGKRSRGLTGLVGNRQLSSDEEAKRWEGSGKKIKALQ